MQELNNNQINLSVIKLGKTLLVTLPPEPDDATISELQEKILFSIEHFRAKGLILDISQVDTLDSYFSRTIDDTTRMVKLMGGISVIAGMQVSVAITTTQLGLTFGNVKTVLNVDKALDYLNDIL